MAPPDAAATAGGFEVRFDPPSSVSAVSPVVRLVVDPPPDEPDSVVLFEGRLSAYHLGRVASGELPNTLIERQILVQTWRADGALVVAPERILRSGEVHSLACAGGSLIEFTVGDNGDFPPPLQRIWPPATATGEPRAVYCGDADVGEFESEALLQPGNVRARIVPGVATGIRENECLTIETMDPQTVDTVLLPPPTLGGQLLDPAPLRIARVSPSEEPGCSSEESVFGPGCVRIEDDRLEIAPTATARLWAMLTDRVAFAEPVADAPAVIKGLKPGAQNQLELTVLDDAAHRWTGKLTFTTLPPRSHIVINEVLANPVGAEPAQEWVELVNDGDDAVELEGWTIEDTGAPSSLSSASLAPGEYALIVPEGYEESSAFDISPVAGTLMLRLESLGNGGIRNTGEPLVLRDATGAVRSAFPGLGGAPEGFSTARRKPWAPDVPESFAVHAEPGASPGAPNVVE